MSEDSKKEKCASCRFWEKLPNKTHVGECKRFPPTLDREHMVVSLFPCTQANTWCGEYAPKEGPLTRIIWYTNNIELLSRDFVPVAESTRSLEIGD